MRPARGYSFRSIYRLRVTPRIAGHMKKVISSWQTTSLALAFLIVAVAATAQNFTLQVGDTVADGAPGIGAGRITVNTENDYYTFNGTAGQSIFVEEISVAFAGWLRWELKSPEFDQLPRRHVNRHEQHSPVYTACRLQWNG